MAAVEHLLRHCWSGPELTRAGDRVRVSLSAQAHKGLAMEVVAPYFGDPSPPGGKPGMPYPELWDYEVVEAFFLDSSRRRYLEVELSPLGEHLILLLDGDKSNVVRQGLQVNSAASRIDYANKLWRYRVVLPAEFFPPDVKYFNLYAIHNATGEEEQQQYQGRCYECLFPAPDPESSDGGPEIGRPDFHRLDCFGELESTDALLPGNKGSELSKQWEKA